VHGHVVVYGYVFYVYVCGCDAIVSHTREILMITQCQKITKKR